jgi:hypothetical protein
MKNEWGADPEKYKRLSEPFESVEQCEAAMNAFLVAIGKLRESYKIPELIVSFQACARNKDGEVNAYTGGAGWGDQLLQAALARRSADEEMAHLARVISAISRAYPDAHDMLITDPDEEMAHLARAISAISRAYPDAHDMLITDPVDAQSEKEA